MLRSLLPALLILGWLAGMALGGPYFGRVGEVSSNDRTAYLPETAEATEVSRLAPEFTGSDEIPAIVVITSEEQIDSPAVEQIAASIEALRDLEAVGEEISPPIPSEDSLAVQAFVPLDPDADLGEATHAIEDVLARDLPAGLDAHVTGPAGFSADLGDAFAGIDGLLLAVALAAVLVILVLAINLLARLCSGRKKA